MKMQRTLLAAALLGLGGLALAMPGGPHRHGDGEAQTGPQAGCAEGMGMGMKDGAHRGHAMTMGGMPRHGEGMMRHRHGQAPAAPAEKAPPKQP